MDMTIGERIAAARKRKKMSQEDLGLVLDVHAATVMRIEGGQTSPRIDQVRAIALALDLSVEDLVL